MNDHINSYNASRGIRHSNALAALRVLFLQRQVSRAELARALGLNRSSSGSIISELLQALLVREVDEGKQKSVGKSGSGRPGVLLELDPLAASFVGVEIGVEHISALRIDMAANVIDFNVEKFDGRSTPVEDAVVQAIAQAFENIPKDDLTRIRGVGLTSPAQMDRNGRVRLAPILGWQDVDLAALAQAALPFDVPVMIENEANSFAFGENYRDPEKRVGVSLFLVMESGVGGGIVIDGRLFRGAHGLAGEIGHIVARNDQELEQVLGLGRLLDRHREITNRQTSNLQDLLNDVQDREPKAVQIADDWAKDLAVAVVAVCRLIDPDRIVLGGSVAALYPMVAGRVAQYIDGLQALTFPTPKIEVHEAAETGAAYGAACMLHKRFLSSEETRTVEGALG
jgi:predicted NBD/HSP70 family sugar kinase